MDNGIENHPIELELTLIRHGYTQWNAERRYLGHTDLPLLPHRLVELAALKAQLELTGGFWRVYCSDLLRCRETLAYLAPSLEQSTVYDKRLREMNFGDWEGCTYEQLKDNEQYRSWLDDPAAITPPNGESWGQFEERLLRFLTDMGQAAEATGVTGDSEVIKPTVAPHANESFLWGNDISYSVSASVAKHPPRRVLIVTHGGVIRSLLAQLVPAVTFLTAVAPAPGTVTVLRLIWRNGQWSKLGLI